tara:strand:- start:3196 stop:4788 length:1593 start_codon:yes stop_codon:yes gene_type:complete
MPRVSLVGNGHGGSEDYATLSLWWAAESAIDYGSQIEAQCLGDCGSTILFSGATPHSYSVYTKGILYDGTNESSLAVMTRLDIESPGTVKHIEITRASASDTLKINAEDVIVEFCRIKNPTTASNSIEIEGFFTNSIVRNCVVSGATTVVQAANQLGCKVLNCTVFGGTSFGFNASSGTQEMFVENTFSFNNGGSDFDSANLTLTNSASDDLTGTITGYTSAELVNFATNDFRTKSTSFLATAGSGGTFIGAFLEAGGSGISITALLNSNYMIEYNMKKNVASQSIGAQMITIADGSDFTGTVAVEVTIDGGTKAAGGGSVTHEGEGYHSYGPTQAETNGNHIAVSFAGTGALTQTIQVYTAFPQTVDNNTKIALIPTTAMRGTDSANTVVPPSVAQFNARTIVSADYFLVADYTAPDNTSITSILADTNELQTNQGNWLTATGFSTSVEVAALNDISVTDILTTQMTESYAGDGTAPTLAQSLFLTMQNLQDFSYTGTTQTVKKLDGSTTAATYTLNDAVTPTSKTRVS